MEDPQEELLAWSCCGDTDPAHRGCRRKPHQFKVMISVRAETNPPTRIENVEVSVVRELEISIFPGAEYHLQLAITSRLADMMHEYFSIDHIDYEALANTNNASGEIDKGVKSSNAVESSSSGKPPIPRGRGVPSRPSVATKASEAPKKDGKAPQSSPTNVIVGRDNKAAPVSKVVVHSNRQECVYLRYIRVGNINLDVSTAGFPIGNVSNFKVVLKAFVDRGSLCVWKELVWSLEKHFIMSFGSHQMKNILTWKSLSPSSNATNNTNKVLSPTSKNGRDAVTESAVEMEESQAMQDKMESLLGIRYSESAPHSPSRFLPSLMLSGPRRYLSELRKKFTHVKNK